MKIKNDIVYQPAANGRSQLTVSPDGTRADIAAAVKRASPLAEALGVELTHDRVGFFRCADTLTVRGPDAAVRELVDTIVSSGQALSERLPGPQTASMRGALIGLLTPLKQEALVGGATVALRSQKVVDEIMRRLEAEAVAERRVGQVFTWREVGAKVPANAKAAETARQILQERLGPDFFVGTGVGVNEFAVTATHNSPLYRLRGATSREREALISREIASGATRVLAQDAANVKKYGADTFHFHPNIEIEPDLRGVHRDKLGVTLTAIAEGIETMLASEKFQQVHPWRKASRMDLERITFRPSVARGW